MAFAAWSIGHHECGLQSVNRSLQIHCWERNLSSAPTCPCRCEISLLSSREVCFLGQELDCVCVCMCAHAHACMHTHTHGHAHMCGFIQQGWCGRSLGAKTQNSLGRRKPQPFLPSQPVLHEQPSIVYPQTASFLLPCNKSKLLSKDNGGTMVLFTLPHRGKADNTGIYLTSSGFPEASYSLMN